MHYCRQSCDLKIEFKLSYKSNNHMYWLHYIPTCRNKPFHNGKCIWRTVTINPFFKQYLGAQCLLIQASTFYPDCLPHSCGKNRQCFILIVSLIAMVKICSFTQAVFLISRVKKTMFYCERLPE